MLDGTPVYCKRPKAQTSGNFAKLVHLMVCFWEVKSWGPRRKLTQEKHNMNVISSGKKNKPLCTAATLCHVQSYNWQKQNETV